MNGDDDENAMCACGHRRWRHDGDFGECTVERCSCDAFEDLDDES